MLTYDCFVFVVTRLVYAANRNDLKVKNKIYVLISTNLVYLAKFVHFMLVDLPLEVPDLGELMQI